MESGGEGAKEGTFPFVCLVDLVSLLLLFASLVFLFFFIKSSLVGVIIVIIIVVAFVVFFVLFIRRMGTKKWPLAHPKSITWILALQWRGPNG